ncbi:MAG TPA: hypothetical protein VKB53_10750 [Gammaproteobacteria bacterium]|jgi:hypothetical protein|nr:hypothetical protein [Gammaproteobacteria bacterium]
MRPLNLVRQRLEFESALGIAAAYHDAPGGAFILPDHFQLNTAIASGD